MSWRVSSTVVNVSPCTRPSSLRDSHVCIIAGVFLRARSVCQCWHVNGVCVVVEGDWWHLWLVAWLCHPHVCLFAIHHKWHSLHIPTFCCTTTIGWQEDLVTYHHAFVGCFVTTPFLFQSQLSPLLSQTTLSSHVHFFMNA